MLTLSIDSNNKCEIPESVDSTIESVDYESVDPPTEFNGLPVVRAPKELGRRGLTNKNIIMHPSGFKLSKVPNGYIILCVHADCGNIGSREGIKCIRHVESYKYCRQPDCDKQANFGYELRKSLYCASHKHSDMVDVIHKKCAMDGCVTLPYFGYPGGPHDYCSKHKLEGMVDVIHKKCIFPGCNKSPCYGNKDFKGVMGGRVPEYCAEHRPDGTINLSNKRCSFKDCKLTASFGVPGGPAQFCGKHRSPDMIDNRKKKCLASGCGISPSYAFPGDTSKYCTKHKLDGMVDVRNKSCSVEECLIYACFGFQGKSAEYCNHHKLPGMTNVKVNKCEFLGCLVRARFGLPNSLPKYCALHKSTDMINLRDKRCRIPDCDTRPSMCALFAPGKTVCKRHASLNDYSYPKKNPICHELKCFNPALFIDAHDTTIYPVRCRDHCLPTDIELIKRLCPNCEDEVHYPSNRELCMKCGKYRDLLIISLREEAVERLLIASNIQFIHDKRVSRGGSRHRPDFLIPVSFGYIIIEVDENQHNKYFDFEEELRMQTIYHDTQLIAPGKQVLFLRYNPDNYDSPLMLHEKQRLEYLQTIINAMATLPSLGIPLGYTKLFYDNFNGSPVIQPLAVL